MTDGDVGKTQKNQEEAEIEFGCEAVTESRDCDHDGRDWNECAPWSQSSRRGAPREQSALLS